jgi:uncharacterized protein YfiM (DUF2279 family)
MSKTKFLFALFFCCFSGLIFSQEPLKNGDLILFSKTFQNYAWTHQYKGFFIDSDGNLNRFDYAACKASPLDSLAGSNKVKSNADLKNQFSTGLKFVKKVNMKELNEMKRLIDEVAAASCSEPISRGRDRGAWVWKAYAWDTTGSHFKAIKLKETGDFFSQNTATAAVKIIDWLDGLNKK